MGKYYGEDTIEIPQDKGRPFLELTQILSQEHYSGPYNGTGDTYKFVPTDGKPNIVIVNPVEGIMRFIYTSQDGREETKKRFLSIKQSVETKLLK